MWHDVRFALRSLRRSPGFAAVAVISLALGIGANTAVFSLLYQVVLRSVPVRDPGSLVLLESDDYSYGWTRRDNNKTVFSYPMYRALRDRNQVFSGLIGRSSFQATLAWHGEAQRATAEVVTGNFFEVLGVTPALGRLLRADDDAPGRPAVIVVSHSFWMTHMGADASAAGASVVMNGHVVEVAGIAPRGFRGLLPGQTPDFYAPVSLMPEISPGWIQSDHPEASWLNLFGRLKPGVSARQASAALLPLFRAELQSEIPRMNVRAEVRQKLLGKPISANPAAQGLSALRERWERPLLVLAVMVGLILMMACANVANLLVARATARQREIAVRLALGASRRQLTRLLLAESTVLALAGGLLGLLLSDTLAESLLSQLPPDATGGWLSSHLDARLLGYSLALALLTSLLFGLVPVWQARRRDLVPALKDQGTGSSPGAAQSRARQVLVVAQVSMSVLLLIGAGLFTRTLVNLLRSDPGFRAARLLTFSIDPSLSGYDWARSLAAEREVQARLSSLPGVQAVARAALSPFRGFGWGSGVKAPGSRNAGQEFVDCSQNAVGPGYFATLGIPVLAGRDFTAADTAKSPKVAILSQGFAQFLFGTQNPVGRHLLNGPDNADLLVVGVVRDTRYNDLREKPPHFLYVPLEQLPPDFITECAFLLRARGDERGVMSGVRGAVRQVDANLPMDNLNSMEVMIDNTMYTERLIAMLAVAFGVLASVLAAVGLYGTLAYSVARRTREFGIRLALGANPRDLLGTVMRELARLVVLGVALGLPAGYGLARLVEAQFFGVRAYDPVVLGGATIIIAAVAVLAGLAPAHRAMRTEPLRALRYE